MIVCAKDWFIKNKFKLTCKGAQFELLKEEAYGHVLALLNSVPYAFNVSNGAGDYITPLLAKFLQVVIKVFDVKQFVWHTYYPNAVPVTGWKEIRLVLFPDHYDTMRPAADFVLVELPFNGSGGYEHERVTALQWVEVAKLALQSPTVADLISIKLAAEKGCLKTCLKVCQMGPSGLMCVGISRQAAAELHVFCTRLVANGAGIAQVLALADLDIEADGANTIGHYSRPACNLASISSFRPLRRRPLSCNDGQESLGLGTSTPSPTAKSEANADIAQVAAAVADLDTKADGANSGDVTSCDDDQEPLGPGTSTQSPTAKFCFSCGEESNEGSNCAVCGEYFGSDCDDGWCWVGGASCGCTLIDGVCMSCKDDLIGSDDSDNDSDEFEMGQRQDDSNPCDSDDNAFFSQESTFPSQENPAQVYAIPKKVLHDEVDASSIPDVFNPLREQDLSSNTVWVWSRSNECWLPGWICSYSPRHVEYLHGQAPEEYDPHDLSHVHRKMVNETEHRFVVRPRKACPSTWRSLDKPPAVDMATLKRAAQTAATASWASQAAVTAAVAAATAAVTYAAAVVVDRPGIPLAIAANVAAAAAVVAQAAWVSAATTIRYLASAAASPKQPKAGDNSSSDDDDEPTRATTRSSSRRRTAPRRSRRRLHVKKCPTKKRPAKKRPAKKPATSKKPDTYQQGDTVLIYCPRFSWEWSRQRAKEQCTAWAPAVVSGKVVTRKGKRTYSVLWDGDKESMVSASDHIWRKGESHKQDPKVVAAVAAERASKTAAAAVKMGVAAAVAGCTAASALEDGTASASKCAASKARSSKVRKAGAMRPNSQARGGDLRHSRALRTALHNP